MYINSGGNCFGIRLHKLAVALGIFIVSAPAFRMVITHTANP